MTSPNRLRSLLLALLAATSPLVLASAVTAAPSEAVSSTPRPTEALFTQFDPRSTIALDHSDFGQFISALTTIQGDQRMVDYAAIDRSVAKTLNAYIDRLASLPVSRFNRNEQLAYWLNLHNALTIKLLAASNGRGNVDRYRGFPDSSGKLFAQPAVTVEGIALSPDQIVNNIIRAGFKDPMALYGVFTGAYGSPPLKGVPYTGANVQDNLKAQADYFINSGLGVKAKGSKLELSSFYQWYADDFGGEAGVREHILARADRNLKPDVAAVDTISRYRFNYRIASFDPNGFNGAAGYSGGGTYGGGSFPSGGGGGSFTGGGGS